MIFDAKIDMSSEQARIVGNLEYWLLCAGQTGLVVTVERRPLQPLAMGNHEAVVTVRHARKVAE